MFNETVLCVFQMVKGEGREEEEEEQGKIGGAESKRYEMFPKVKRLNES